MFSRIMVANELGQIAAPGGVGFALRPISVGAVFPAQVDLQEGDGLSDVMDEGAELREAPFNALILKTVANAQWHVTVFKTYREWRSWKSGGSKGWALLATSRIQAGAVPIGSGTTQSTYLDWVNNQNVNNVGAQGWWSQNAPRPTMFAKNSNIVVNMLRWRRLFFSIINSPGSGVPSGSLTPIMWGLVDPSDNSKGEVAEDQTAPAISVPQTDPTGMGWLIGQNAISNDVKVGATAPGDLQLSGLWAPGIVFGFKWTGAAFALAVDMPCYLYAEYA